MSVAIWTSRVKECSISDQTAAVSVELSGLFNLDINNPQVSSLQNDILDNYVDFEQEINSADLYDGDWPGFVELCKSYMQFCRDVDPQNMQGSFDLYAQVLTDLQAAFASGKGNVLEATVVKVGRIVVPLALQIDRSDNDPNMLRTSYMSTVLLKMFNTIRGEKIDRSVQADNYVSKKRIILYVATTLCRLYFRLDQPGSCANVFSNIHTANLQFSTYSKAQRVELRYWLGRFYLIKGQLKDAYSHLSWSFANCHPQSLRNKRLILTYLTPPSILLGIMPSHRMLQYYRLDEMYGPLVDAIKTADYGMYMNHLRHNEAWFLARNVCLLLRSRAYIPLFRMAIFRLWKIKGGTTSLSFEDIDAALKVSMRSDSQGGILVGQDPGLEQVENICISLISQGLIKANIFTRTGVLRLKPIGAFPRLTEFYRVGSFDGGLQGREKWMEG